MNRDMPEDRSQDGELTALRDALGAELLRAGSNHERKSWFKRQPRLAVLVAAAVLVAVPAGVATAELLPEDGVSVSDCPDLVAGLEQKNVGSDGLLLDDCPVGETEVARVVDLMVTLDRQRAELQPGEQGLVGFGHSSDGDPWSISGVAGSGEDPKLLQIESRPLGRKAPAPIFAEGSQFADCPESVQSEIMKLASISDYEATAGYPVAGCPTVSDLKEIAAQGKP